MEPIPQTLEALTELDQYSGEHGLLEQLTISARRARQVAPGVVGMSLASRHHDLTFTLVATDDEIAALDAAQYAASGPCVDAFELGHGIASSPHGLLDESRWHIFAAASASLGVHSTLTFPILRLDEVVATVNLYGREQDTFTGKHQELADVFGAWSAGAVTNADLAFSTREVAQEGPAKLEQIKIIDIATGILAVRQDISLDQARAQLESAARRAGIPVVDVARLLVNLGQQD